MVEDQAIVLVLNLIDVFVDQKLDCIKFSMNKREEIFEFDRNTMMRHSQHLVAMQKFLDIF